MCCSLFRFNCGMLAVIKSSEHEFTGVYDISYYFSSLEFWFQNRVEARSHWQISVFIVFRYFSIAVCIPVRTNDLTWLKKFYFLHTVMVRDTYLFNKKNNKYRISWQLLSRLPVFMSFKNVELSEYNWYKWLRTGIFV